MSETSALSSNPLNGLHIVTALQLKAITCEVLTSLLLYFLFEPLHCLELVHVVI